MTIDKTPRPWKTGTADSLDAWISRAIPLARHCANEGCDTPDPGIDWEPSLWDRRRVSKPTSLFLLGFCVRSPGARPRPTSRLHQLVAHPPIRDKSSNVGPHRQAPTSGSIAVDIRATIIRLSARVNSCTLMYQRCAAKLHQTDGQAARHPTWESIPHTRGGEPRRAPTRKAPGVRPGLGSHAFESARVGRGPPHRGDRAAQFWYEWGFVSKCRRRP